MTACESFLLIKNGSSNLKQLAMVIEYICIYIYIYIYIYITDGGLRTLCHSCGFACQKRVLKTFPGLGYLRSEYGVVHYGIYW